MHAVALRILRTASRPASRNACRIIAGVRYPLSPRQFHRTALLQQGTNESTPAGGSEETKKDSVPAEGANAAELTGPSAEVPDQQHDRDTNLGSRDESTAPEAKGENSEPTEDAPDPTDLKESEQDVKEDSPATSTKAGRLRSARVARQRKQPEGLPPVVLPEWFWEKNVKLFGQHQAVEQLAKVYGGGVTEDGQATYRMPAPVKLPSPETPENGAVKDDSASMSMAEYSRRRKFISRHIANQGKIVAENLGFSPELDEESGDLWNEVRIVSGQIMFNNIGILRDALRLQEVAKGALNPPADDKHLVNESVFKEVRSSVKASLHLRPSKKLPEKNIPRPVLLLHCPKEGGTLFLDTIVENIAADMGADLISLDAVDLAQIVGPYIDESVAWTYSGISLLGYEANRLAGSHEHSGNGFLGTPTDALPGQEDDPMRKIISFHSSKLQALGKGQGSGSPLDILLGGGSQKADGSSASNDQWTDLKITTVLEALVGAADTKRATAFKASEGTESVQETSPPKDLIIQVKDFKEISETSTGLDIISKLRTVVNKLWFSGRNIAIVGTTSMWLSHLTKASIQETQSDVVDADTRTILVPPALPYMDMAQSRGFVADEKLRRRTINLRHVEDMIKRLAGDDEIVADLVTGFNSLREIEAGMPDEIEDSVWAYSDVHRLATTVLGFKPAQVTGRTVWDARELLQRSDKTKLHWGLSQKQLLGDASKVLGAKRVTAMKLETIKKTCTPYEKKLLGGVIVPAEITTTFRDVHAPKETIDALKSLTTLSLVRPQAFSYGVLATDKIPGLLLYGPPGTGKTLLAKAVAKESGATVLEISGAEVYNKYVGEGEKNVKAVFSLAKKLSPCVVFIDEADAIFSSRGTSERNSHRELLNQFLKEWDGMNALGAFIMVATNRPFDLDDAVLRRLPRRLLVDLPVAKDRESILKIHLKDEQLGPCVSLADLAKDTPFYSGSDLKNVAVAAALACIRSENAAAAAQAGKGPHIYPPKRVLTKEHFETAMQEISASINEDMRSLRAIRKFDERFGDRKGRRKKAAGMGFGGTTVVEMDSAAGRVRKLEV